MATGAPRPCTYPGCGAVVSKGSRCQAHPYAKRRTHAARERNKLYNTAQWRTRRKVYLNGHPLCVECEKAGRVTPATVVDHIRPHKGDPVLFFDESNWQGLCAKHHNRKTASTDGGFGNR